MTNQPALTLDTLREMNWRIKELMRGVPAGIVMAFDVEVELRTEPRVVELLTVKDRPPETGTFYGLPYRTSPELHPGEWFVYDSQGKVIKWNGNQSRIELLASALVLRSAP